MPVRLFLSAILLLTVFASRSQIPPTQVYLTGRDLKIPQYDFDHLKPLLHPANDTTYVINFWATWCVPCVQEIPAFERITDSFKNKPVRVVLVSLDLYKNAAESLPAFVNAKKLKSKVLFLHPSGSRWIDEVDSTWDGSLPVTLICNKSSRIFVNSATDFGSIKEKILKFIKQ